MMRAGVCMCCISGDTLLLTYPQDAVGNEIRAWRRGG